MPDLELTVKRARGAGQLLHGIVEKLSVASQARARS